jgi:hypothetical protein
MKYFTDCNTIDQAKNAFRNLCKSLHPDTSGRDSQAEFIAMYSEFKKFKPSNQTEQQKENYTNFDPAEFYDMIKNFDQLEEINISFVGSFIWLEDETKGATYEQKDIIKSIKLIGYNNARFASVKKSWYYSPEDYQQKSKDKKTLEQIKSTYGCKTFKNSKSYKIA